MKVVMDCDNTIGIPGRDLDDALALFYLLGRDDVELIGVATKHPKRITVLATGAMTNLLGALRVDHDFFRNLKADVLMGGATGALFINRRTMHELNFSCDAEAAYHVLRSDSKTMVITGNLCLQALLYGQGFGRIAGQTEFVVFNYVQKPVADCSEYLYDKYGLAGFHVWDAVAASYVVRPELFDDCRLEVLSAPAELETGFLKIAAKNEQGYRINAPTELRDRDRYWDELIRAWENAL